MPPKNRTDRTKYGPTRSRSEQAKKHTPWWQVGCGALIGCFLWLFGTAAGLGLMAHGAVLDLPKQFGYHTSPVLHMKMVGCVETRQGKNRTINCYGTGDPGRSGVVDSVWMIAGAESVYPKGKIVDVRCSRSGGCEETGTSEKARDLAEAAFGLLLFSGMLAVALAMFANRRGRGGPSRRTTRALLVAAGTVLAVALVSTVVAFAT